MTKTERVIKAARRVLNNWLDGTDCPDVSGDFAELEYAIREYDGEEKQKEQKPAEWDDYKDKVQVPYCSSEPEWSEEDEKMLSDVLKSLRRYQLSMPNYQVELQMRWLKSLRPSWKPSEEQIYSLGTVVKGVGEASVGSIAYNLKELYEQLKKL